MLVVASDRHFPQGSLSVTGVSDQQLIVASVVLCAASIVGVQNVW